MPSPAVGEPACLCPAGRTRDARVRRKMLVPGLPPFEQALTITLTRLMLLHPLILGPGSVATAMLNSKRQFLRPALSIAIYDVGLIGGVLVSFAVPAVGIYGPTVGSLVSSLLQVGVLVPPLMKQGVSYTFLRDLKHPGLYEVLGHSTRCCRRSQCRQRRTATCAWV